MVYIPNPTDATQPTGNVDASTADDEFRALKAYILGLALTAGMFAPVRQCANDGFVNATGDPAFMIAAVAGGQALDLKATGRPLVVNFAGGSTGTGVNDRNSTLTGDTANIITGLPASNTSYIYADYVNAASWTWGQTLAPVQYAKVYPQTIGSILQFAGAAGATTFLDDFGNTWVAQGGAKVQTDQFKFGTGGLGGAGASNALNGVADFIKSANFTSLGSGSWAMRAWVRPTALPGAAAAVGIVNQVNNTGFGARLDIFNNAGTTKFSMTLSSTGAAHDIATGVQGTTTPLINTWYFVELTFDSLAGVYRLYVNGAQEATVASALKICAVTAADVGAVQGAANSFVTGYIDKPEFLSYCQHPAGTVYAVPTAAPSISAAGYAPDAFDIQAMKMYSVTGPSTAAGSAPATTQKYRVYLGEVNTGVAVPSLVTNYAFNGQAVCTPFAAASGFNNVIHNLGVRPQRAKLSYINVTSQTNVASVGDELDFIAATPAAPATNGISMVHGKNGSTVFFSSGTVYTIDSAGNAVSLVGASYRARLAVARGWGGAS